MRTSRAIEPLLVEGDPGPARAEERQTLDQRDARLRTGDADFEDGAAHPDRGGRRRDRIGSLVERAGSEAKDAFGEIDRQLLRARPAGVDEAVERHARDRPDRQIGRIEEDQLRERSLASADDFVAIDRISGFERTCGARKVARDLVLRKRSRTDVLLRLRTAGGKSAKPDDGK
jgi:hypothetical protein